MRAATELRERARAALLRAGRLDLSAAIGQSRIGTVNAVCGQLIQRFCFELGLSPDQTVVETGPYRLIRHPSYTGGILTGVGIGLSMRLALAPILIGLASFLGYWIRMRVEERALAEGIGEPYRAYMRRTKRLAPFIW